MQVFVSRWFVALVLECNTEICFIYLCVWGLVTTVGMGKRGHDIMYGLQLLSENSHIPDFVYFSFSTFYYTVWEKHSNCLGFVWSGLLFLCPEADMLLEQMDGYNCALSL